MRSNYFFILFATLLFTNVNAENLFIQSKNITIDKNKEISIFENEVLVRTEENNEIISDYAEYDKKKGLIKFKDNIVVLIIKIKSRQILQNIMILLKFSKLMGQQKY